MTHHRGETTADEQAGGALHQPGWSLRPATADDASWMADLKAQAMREDLQRLGRYEWNRARQRFLETYVPANTSVILAGGQVAGCIAVRGEVDAWWIEHFYLHAVAQGRGMGGQVLHHMIAAHGDGRPFALVMVRGSRARALYERHGFTHHHDHGIDQIFQRPPP